MEYNALEKQTLDILERTDFKAIKKDEAVSITSMLSNLRPDIAKAVIERFPELAELLKASIREYKGILDKVIQSDDASIQHAYDAAEKTIDDAAVSREQFIQFAEKVHADYSKYLDKDGITSKEGAEILNNEMELLRMVYTNEKEVRDQQEKMLNVVDHKDKEKRQLNWAIIGAASAALITAVGVGLTALGGKVDFKLPSK